MTPWQVLGIEPTADRRSIKKAYALLLKSSHPEDDPKGFQELREAYERAIAWASFQEREAPEPETRREPTPDSALPEPASWGEPQRVRLRVEELMERVRELHADAEQRANEEAWRRILADDALWSLDVRAGFAAHLFGFLLDSWQDLDRAILILLEEEFRFREDGLSLHRSFGPPHAVDSVLSAIHTAFSERPLRGFENRRMFELTESKGGWLDDRLPSFDWLPDLLGRLPKGLRFALFLMLAGNFYVRSCDRLQGRPPDFYRQIQSRDPVERLQAAARLGNPQASTDLAELYLRGEQGLPKDPGKALELIRSAANRGNPGAQRRLGEACLEGWSGAKDPAAAAQWFALAADKGDSVAQFRLATLYFRGDGVPQDDEAARRWLLRAAREDHAEARAWLGVLYEEGRGVPADSIRAAEWYRRAAEQELRWAQFRLGRLLVEGPESLRNPESAFFWLSLASGDENYAAEAAPLLRKARSELSREQIFALEQRLQRWVGYLAKKRAVR